MYPQALSEYEKIADQGKVTASGNQFVASLLGWVCAVSGRRAEALKTLEEFRNLSSHSYVDSYQVAMIYMGLGDKDGALRLLEKGYEERSPSMTYLAVDTFWEGVHSDPRYTDLLRRIGLPQ